MNATQLFNPLMYGKITRADAEKSKAPYTRNGENKELRELMKTLFQIPDDFWHFEELDGDWIAAINNRNEVVRRIGE